MEKWSGKDWTRLRASRVNVPAEIHRRLVVDGARLYTTLSYQAVVSVLDSATGEIVINDAINRIITMNVPEATLNSALVPGRYFYDLIMFDNSAPPIRVALQGGEFNFTIGITGG